MTCLKGKPENKENTPEKKTKPTHREVECSKLHLQLRPVQNPTSAFIMTRAGELKLKLVNHGDTARPDATGGTQPCLEGPQPRGGGRGKEGKGRKEKGEEAVSQTNVYFR